MIINASYKTFPSLVNTVYIVGWENKPPKASEYIYQKAPFLTDVSYTGLGNNLKPYFTDETIIHLDEVKLNCMNLEFLMLTKLSYNIDTIKDDYDSLNHKLCCPPYQGY